MLKATALQEVRLLSFAFQAQPPVVDPTECIFCLTFFLIVSSFCPLLPVALVLEHGEQRHM